MADDDESQFERLAAGLTREWRRQGNLVIYTLYDFTTPTLDAYIDSCTLMVRDHQPYRPEYGLHYFAFSELKVTSSLYSQLMRLADVLRDNGHRAVAGVVFPDTWIFRSLTTLGEIFARRSGNVQICYFIDFDTALAWIEGVIERDKQTF